MSLFLIMDEHKEQYRKETVLSAEERIVRLKDLLENNRDAEMYQFLSGTEPEDVAEILGEFSAPDKVRIFNVLDSDDAAVVLDDTDPQSRHQILQNVDSSKLSEVLEEMPVDEAADIVEEVPEKDREDILRLMEEEDAEEVAEILSYPEDSAARVMNPDFVSVSEEDNVEDAIQHIRSLEVDDEVFNIYVINDESKLGGVVPIRKLLTVPRGTRIKDIMDTDVHPVAVDEDRGKAALVMKKYDITSLPVIDARERLVGRITVDDIIDVMDEERAEDISKMTGTIEEERGTETTLKATQNRLQKHRAEFLGQ